MPISQTFYKNAAVLPTGFHGGERKYVFAIERNGEASTFGGRKDKTDSGPMMTAARETDEEALKIFGDQHAVKKVLLNYKNNGAKRIHNVPLNNVTYIAPLSIPNHPIQTFHDRRISLLQAGKLPAWKDEIHSIIVVSESELRKQLDRNHRFLQGHQVRGHVWNTLRLARNQGYI